MTKYDQEMIRKPFQQWEYEIMTKYDINYRKVDKEEQEQQQQQQSYFKDLAHKCSRSKSKHVSSKITFILV